MSPGHGELMDDVYSFQRHVYDLTRPFFLFGRDRLLRRLDPPAGGTVLEVGCGTARNLVVAARMRPDVRLHGLDVSAAMLETARASVARNGLSDRIVLRRGDAGDLDVGGFGLSEVDRVFFSYTLSMMPPWRAALRRGAEALAPGGSLHVVDFGQYERLPGALRRAHHRWSRSYHVHPREDLRAVLAALAADLDMTLEFESLYRGYAWSAALRRR